MRDRLIVIGPLPPPAHGVTISTSLVLANPVLREHFEVEHLDTSDHRTGANINTWEVGNFLLGLWALARLARKLVGRRGTIYIPLSQGAPGFLRDSLYIRLAALLRWRVAVHLRGGELHHFYARQGRVFRRWIRSTLGRVDSMGIMGASLRPVFDGLMPSERLAVVPNGTPDLYRNGHVREPGTVLFLSNLRPRKGLLESIDAALLVLKRHERAQFLFVGNWYDETFEREVRERARPAGDRIRFLPPAVGTDKDELLLRSSILLFPPSEPEGHPRVVLEAIAAGLPTVTTNRGAIAETVLDGVHGFVLEDPVPERLAERLLTLLSDDELRERMGRAARERYLSSFTQEEADLRLANWLVSVARGE
jgi:glycosyltransferase involved in cell wall biosynthesis